MTRQGQFATLIALDVDQIAALRAEYPDAPEDYLIFLEGSGYGAIGSLTIYSGLVEPTSIFGNETREMDSCYRAFADFNGDIVAAFDLNSWTVIEIDEHREIKIVDRTFTAFLNRWLTIIDE